MRINLEDLPPLPTIEGWEVRHLAGWIGYAVGSDGSIWSCRQLFGRGPIEWHRLTPTVQESGHLKVQLSDYERRWRPYVHTLVLITFVGPRPPGMEARHFPDYHPTNNTICNLSWATDKQNVADCIAMGRHRTGNLRGELNGMAKLTDQQVRELYQMGKDGARLMDIAAKFGMSASGLSQIFAGINWKHLGLEPITGFNQRYDRTGENNSSAKLTAADVMAIRDRYAKREASQVKLAAEFKVTQGLISAIIRRRVWRCV